MDLVLRTGFEEAAQHPIAFRAERFHHFADKTPSLYPLPQYELLFEPPEGHTATDFFDSIRSSQPGRIVDTDLAILVAALNHQKELGCAASINMNAETFFDPRLVPILEDFFVQNPFMRRSDTTLEITEQGGIPKNFNEAQLRTIKAYGFPLALDDFDPTEGREWKRLKAFAPYMNIIKMPYQVIEACRETLSTSYRQVMNDVDGIVKGIRSFTQNSRIIAEGYDPHRDARLLAVLKLQGIGSVQEADAKYNVPAPDNSPTVALGH